MDRQRHVHAFPVGVVDPAGELIGVVGVGSDLDPVPHGLHPRRLGRCVTDDEPVDRAVTRRPQEHRGAGAAARADGAAGGPAGLLDVLLDGGGHFEVDDQGDVGFVDAHAERLRGHDHVHVAVTEGVLDVLACRLLHAAVVGPCRVARCTQQPGDAGGVLAGGHVDDGGPGSERLDHLYDAQISVLGISAGFDVVADLGPVGGEGDGLTVSGSQFQQPPDLVANLRCCGRGDRQGGRPVGPHASQRPGNGRVLGAEGVAPLGDAVRLVHRNPGDADLREGLHELLRPQSLGADVQQLVVAACRTLQYRAPLAQRDAAVNGRNGRDAACAEVLDLIVHEGGEWRDDERQAGRQQRGDLEGDRLARTCRQHRQGVVAVDEAPHRLELAGAPVVELEPFPHPVEPLGDLGGVGEVALGQFHPGDVGPGVGARHRLESPPHLVVVGDIAEVPGDQLIGLVGTDGPFPSGRTGQCAENPVAVRDGAAQPIVQHDGDAAILLGPDESSDPLREPECRPRDHIVGERILTPEFHRLHAGADDGIGGRVERDLLDDQHAERLPGDVDALPERP